MKEKKEKVWNIYHNNGDKDRKNKKMLDSNNIKRYEILYSKNWIKYEEKFKIIK